MRRRTGILLYGIGLVVAVAAVKIPDWHRPIPGQQIGNDGAGMVQFDNTSPWRVAAAPTEPAPPADLKAAGTPASFQNVKVLTDLSPADFKRLHTEMTAWVSPKQGCGFCHDGQNFAADTNPMKEVAREHIRLTRYLNTTWKGHVGEGGVTCFTCHRAEPVPPETWFPSKPKATTASVAQGDNWDEAADTVRKFFPDNGWALYFLHDEPIRAESRSALPDGSVGSQVEVKRVYEMMMQMSDGIGVNCGFCHSSRAFSDWSQSTPARWVGYDAIRMTRDINLNFLFSLQGMPQTRALVKQNTLVLPIQDQNARNGSGLAVCATCHYGHIRPEQGAATLANYPGLGTSVNATPTDPHPASPVPDGSAAPAAPAKSN